jgi:hypothetical protein
LFDGIAEAAIPPVISLHFPVVIALKVQFQRNTRGTNLLSSLPNHSHSSPPKTQIENNGQSHLRSGGKSRPSEERSGSGAKGHGCGVEKVVGGKRSGKALSKQERKATSHESVEGQTA